MRFDAITPAGGGRGRPGDVRPRLMARMRQFANAIWRELATYEVPAPTAVAVNPSRRRAIVHNRRFRRRGQTFDVYRRTNTLKRSWLIKPPRFTGGNLVVEVFSSGQIAPYNIFVRGPKKGPKGKRQAAHMARRGWRTVGQILDKRWPPTARDLRAILRSRRGR